MTTLQPGDPAPAFTAQAHNGQQLRLADYRDKNVVVLDFYPKDGVPVCTKQACGFRDAYEEFTALGAVVIGVSAGSLERHQGFAASRALPILLISDQDGSLRKTYQVTRTLSILPSRVTYVIDKKGISAVILQSPAAPRHNRLPPKRSWPWLLEMPTELVNQTQQGRGRGHGKRARGLHGAAENRKGGQDVGRVQMNPATAYSIHHLLPYATTLGYNHEPSATSRAVAPSKMPKSCDNP